MIDYRRALNSTARRAEYPQAGDCGYLQGIKSLARELNVLIVVPSQSIRGPERETNRKPRRLSVRGSGAIEQDAALVGLLYKSNADDEKRRPRAAGRRGHAGESFGRLAEQRLGWWCAVEVPEIAQAR